MFFKLRQLFLLCISICAFNAQAEGVSQTKYIHLTPAFVVNYGAEGRMKYLRTEVALKVNGGPAAAAVTSHRPYIRNNLVFLLSAQDGNTVIPVQGERLYEKLHWTKFAP